MANTNDNNQHLNVNNKNESKNRIQLILTTVRSGTLTSMYVSARVRMPLSSNLLLILFSFRKNEFQNGIYTLESKRFERKRRKTTKN